MRKRLLFLTIVLVLGLSIIFYGCTNDSKKASSTTNDKPVFKLTIDKIKKKYTDTKIKDIKNIGKEFVIVESQKDTFANRFDVYNLRTGDMDSLPTGAEFVTLDKIENENYFVFLSSGKNSESPFSSFPYLIKCVRIKNDVKQNDDYIALKEDKYFPLDASVQAGSKGEDVMSDITVALDGLEVLFKPMKGKEQEFYADAADIPPTKTSYNKDKKELVFEIGTNQLDNKLLGEKAVRIENNQYMSSYEIQQKDNKIYLVIAVKDTLKEYMAKIKRLPDGLPYLAVEFKNNKEYETYYKWFNMEKTCYSKSFYLI